MQILDRDDSPFRHGKPIPWVVPFERNLRYVDREILGKIKRRLFRQGQSELIAIFGLGGVGKTQIALELAYQTKDLYPDCAVFWLPAVDMESIQQAYQTMAEQLGISPTDPNADVKAIVKKYLSDPCSGRWLLIIDNADELDMWAGSERSSSEGLTRYLPTSTQGAILLTTRNTKVARHVASTDVIEVPEMDEQRATHVLQRCLADHGLLRDAETTRKLLSQLTFLPLAIVQAASFINENHMTLKSYVELLDGQEQSAIDLLSEDFEDKGRYKSIRNPVATTWLTSFEQIRQKNRVAADYLCIMACLQEKDIPFSILPPMGDVDRQKTIGVLSAYSFVRVRHGTSHIDMHRLVHLATRNWLGSINSLRAWQLYVLQGVSNHFPEVEYERRTSWRAVMPHALRLLDLTAGEAPVLERLLLLFKVATCQIYDGRPKEAQHHLEKLLEAATKLYGLEHHLSISALDGLAICYAAQGNPEKAIKLCKRILEVQIRAHGPASHEVNCALYRLSAVYRENGDTEKAGELYREIIPFFMKTLGPSSRQAMGAIYGLVWFYSDQGQISDAAELSLQLLHISRKVFGPDSPLTGNALTALAFIYMKQWRLKEAEDLLKEALDIHQRILGPEHVDTIRTKAWNAELRMYQGRHEEAIALQVECVRLTSEFYGPDHCRTQNLVMKLDEWTQPK
jgi:tetratricopeptide (TPR) repeat protein